MPFFLFAMHRWAAHVRPYAPSTPPPTITDLVAVGATANSAMLSWSAALGAADYLIEYKQTTSPTWLTFTDGVNQLLSVEVTGLLPSTGYDFRVSPINSVGTGSPSNVSSATTAATLTAPGQVQSLSASAQSSVSVLLTFSAPASGGAASDYIAEWSPAGANTWNTYSDAVSSSLSILVQGLTASTAYDFRVHAINAAGSGGVSTTASATTPAASAVFPFAIAAAPAITPAWVGSRGCAADTLTASTPTAPAGSGVVYYIDSVNGNDAWTGLSGTFTSGTTGPWKTLHRAREKTLIGYWDSVAANSSTQPAFHPAWTPAPTGSRFRLARGGTYPGGIRVYSTYSGGVAYHQDDIVFEDYGTGARPHILHTQYTEDTYRRTYTGTGNGTLGTVTPNLYPAASVNSQKWTLTATDAATFTVSGSSSGAQANATVGTAYDNGLVAFTITAGATAFVAGDKFTFDIYNWSTQGAYSQNESLRLRFLELDGDYRNRIAAAANPALNNYNDLKSVQGISLAGPTSAGILCSAVSCEIHDFGGDGVGGTGMSLIQDCWVHHTKINDKYATGAGITGFGDINGRILGNTIEYNGYSTVLSHGIYGGSNGALIQGNVIRYNKNNGVNTHGVHDHMTIADNDIMFNGNGMQATYGGYGTYEELNSWLIERNNIAFNGTSGQGYGIDLNTVTNCHVRNNWVYRNNLQCLSVGGAGGTLVSKTSGVFIYENTFIGAAGNGSSCVQLGNNDTRTEQIQLKGNILYSESTTARALLVQGTNNPNQFDTDDNLFYMPNRTDSKVVSWFGSAYTLGEYQTATSREANGRTGNPNFVDVANDDYHVSAGSAAYLGALDLLITSDKFGTARTSTPTIGACQ